MKKTIFLFIVFLSIAGKAQDSGNKFEWNLEKERLLNANRSDSTKWSSKNWKADTQNVRLTGKPMKNGIFPVPDYELVDSTFNGLGNSGNWNGFEIKGKKIIYHSLYVNKNNINKKFTGDKPNEVFFTIAVLTDSVDTATYSHTNVNISSRNYPHFVGQGFVKTSSNEIDFVSFITADRNAYAIVNMRIFDLRIGRIVLIAPKIDGTLRSLQLDSPIMSSEEMEIHIQDLLENDEKVTEFFTNPGTI